LTSFLVPTVASQTPASAKPVFQVPFPCGETWYMSSYPGHSGAPMAIDFLKTDLRDGRGIGRCIRGSDRSLRRGLAERFAT